MADIFLANDQVLERSVVIKMLLPQYAADPSFVERFRREATSAAKLNHKNVVAVFDWGSHDETFYMAMEYVDGQSLAELLAASPKLPLDTALAITSEAAAGLGFAHANGMVHRDVKPGNIMLTTDGEVKVADFGIARALDGGESLTQTGNVMGTAAYFSPEQARGEDVDRRSDLYSLGVVLFEMVTGQRPFSGSSPVSIAYKHVGEAPPAPTAIDGSLPPAVDSLLANLLAKDPAHRYGDADELRTELQRVAAGQTPLAPVAVRQAAAAAPRGGAGGSGEATAVIQSNRHGPPRREDMGLAGPRANQQTPPPMPAARSSGNGLFIMILAALVVAVIGLIVLIATTLSSDDGSSTESTDVTAPGGVPVTGGSTTEPDFDPGSVTQPEDSTTSEPDEPTTTEAEPDTEPDESTTTSSSTTTSTTRDTTSTTRATTSTTRATTTTTRPTTTTTTTTTTTSTTTTTTSTSSSSTQSTPTT